MLVAGIAAAVAQAAAPPSVWNGRKPFHCKVQDAGEGADVRHPDRDPFCIHFKKTHQTVDELGIVDFLANEPARVAEASPKCFYFQKDHWRSTIVAGNDSTRTYQWQGKYFFDKASGDGGVWVRDFKFNGQTFDPRTLPGFPDAYKPFFGPGEGGTITHNSLDTDPNCVARADAHHDRIYKDEHRSDGSKHGTSGEEPKKGSTREKPAASGLIHLG